MDIKQAREQDIIDVLYLLKQEKDLDCEPYTESPLPEYTLVKKEIEKGRVYILKHHNISIGTFSLYFPGEGKDIVQDKGALQISRMAIASYWINNEILGEILNHLESYARKNSYSRIHFLINSRNKKMNTFYHNLGFDFLGEASSPDTHTSCNRYEKKLNNLS